MLTGNKNLKDEIGMSLKDTSLSISYAKTSKLVTALYMVTDIIDKGEPIRNKLRNLGAEIISDMHSAPTGAGSKIAETVSFLNIASAMNLISEMNCNILKKEFLALSQSLKEYTQIEPIWLEEFLLHPQPLEENQNSRTTFLGEKNTKQQSIGQPKYGRQVRTTIGVQKGSTLMKALSIKTSALSNTEPIRAGIDGFNTVKRQRRDEIINIFQNNSKADSGFNGLTITDIKTRAQGSLALCGEKTLQRELVSMVKDNVLKRTGLKRWSRYSLPK